jgi:hypothetical protein
MNDAGIGSRGHSSLSIPALIASGNHHIQTPTDPFSGWNLAIITGANRGGKSSFLRSIGLAKVMMKCGMFVGAEAIRAVLGRALFD